MNYQSYDQLMERGKGRSLGCYSERHHIWPRSLGGSNYSENLVELTYREHFIAHWLLIKICQGFERRKMLHAFQMMGGRALSSWQYDVSKRVCSDGFEAEHIARRPERIAKHKKKLIEKERAKKDHEVEHVRRFKAAFEKCRSTWDD